MPLHDALHQTSTSIIMTKKMRFQWRLVLAVLSLILTEGYLQTRFGLATCFAAGAGAATERKLLYVAEPGIRNYLEYGGHGLLVFDIDQGHRFVKRIPTAGLAADKKPLNVKGVCASAATKRIYISTLQFLTCLDLVTEKILWEKAYEGGCDRMALSPDGKVIYLPSLEKEHWHVVDALTGDVIKKIVTKSGAHNTIYSLDGNHAYLAGLKSPILRVTETTTHSVLREVGPFGDVIRPFTVNGRGTLCYVNVNDLLGFEIGDLTTGKMLHRIEVQGYSKGPTKRHGCPSHGIGLTPDEKEIWLTDAHNSRMHIFDNTVTPPKQVASLEMRDQPGWVTFSLDGRYAYPSTGDVVEVATRKIVARLKDEEGRDVQSEKILEIDFRGAQPVRAGDQFGLGRSKQ
jgi:DNA-binding beta-propeller fold protein YncE